MTSPRPPAVHRPTILVVEDDPAIRRGLCDILSATGYNVTSAEDGRQGLDLAGRGSVDLVLLDVMLPVLEGFEVLMRLKREQPLMPVILLTARGAESDRVRGLRGGADDYVVKPFSTAELLARVEAVLRRSVTRPKVVGELRIAGRRIDFERREGHLPGGEMVQLTERESELLQHLANNPERAISRAELLRCVWGIDPRGVTTRTVDMAVARLRESLQDDKTNPRIVRTVRNKGYAIGEVDADPPSSSSPDESDGSAPAPAN